MRSAYASHTLSKHSGGFRPMTNVCEHMSFFQVTFMKLCITYSLRTPNFEQCIISTSAYVGNFMNDKISGVYDVRLRMQAYCSVPVTYTKRMPNVCNVRQTYGQNVSYVGIRWRYTLWCEHVVM